MKGIKQDITKASFAKSTLKGCIRKGFITSADIEKTKLTSYTIEKIKQVDFDLLFVRDKQVCFLLDSKNKIVYNCKDCTLTGYVDYFISKNNDYKVIDLQDVHPADLRARGLAVDKIAESKGFTL